MDPSMMGAAMNSLHMASMGELAQYSFGIAKMAMQDQAQTARGLMEMLPDSQGLQVRGPQPGDVPAVMKGSYFDVYA